MKHRCAMLDAIQSSVLLDIAASACAYMQDDSLLRRVLWLALEYYC
jgi:hypothetical protein